MRTNPAIQVDCVTKIFSDFWHRPTVKAVQNLSLNIEPGEIFGLLGPNGSGKSTTIKMMLGLLYPTSGSLKVLGHSPSDVHAKSRIGYLPEESYQYGSLTAEETLHFFGRLFNLDSKSRHAKVRQLLELVGLADASKRRVGEFSKGMARRLGLAQALINDPELLILDEPTSGLDPIGARHVKDLILDLSRNGKTILMTSHLLADVEDVCHRIAILHSGTLQALGKVDELLEEKSSFRICLPLNTTREHAEAVARQAESLTGGTTTIEHPRRNLEEFFIDTINKQPGKDNQ